MSDPTAKAASPPTERVRISCPGCGRNDFVNWPRGQGTLHRKCFNCGKEFDLSRKSAH
jgi:DNA-directed RNA polymerase subunit RPC12/RpoP